MEKSEDNWLENIFGTYKDLRINNPVINISYYEAKAYCRWSNCRLIKESEWEYLANHFKDNILKDANLNGVVGTTVSVLNDRNINDFGVVGLFGNVWEWCEDPFIHIMDLRWILLIEIEVFIILGVNIFVGEDHLQQMITF